MADATAPSRTQVNLCTNLIEMLDLYGYGGNADEAILSYYTSTNLDFLRRNRSHVLYKQSVKE